MQHHRDECILIRNIRSKNFLIEDRGIASFSRSKERNTGREIDGRSPTSALSPVPPALSLFHCLCLFPPDPSFDPLSLTERTSLFLFVVFSSFSTSSSSLFSPLSLANLRAPPSTRRGWKPGSKSVESLVSRYSPGYQEFDARAPITSVFPAWYRVSREYRAACERRIFYQLGGNRHVARYSLVFQNERVQSSVKVTARPSFDSSSSFHLESSFVIFRVNYYAGRISEKEIVFSHDVLLVV